MIDARDIAREYYEGSGRDIEVDAASHIKTGGVVVWTPSLVLMARPVLSGARRANILDPAVFHDRPDAWHLHFISGNAKCLVNLADEITRLPFITFQKGSRGDLRLRKIESARFVRNLR